MKLVSIYECLCDATRLRLLNLLLQGPLCVCHLQAVLGESQVKISKHLGYLRARGLVTSRREGNWMIYALARPAARSPELAANLTCLRKCAQASPPLQRDLAQLKNLSLACTPKGSARTHGPSGIFDRS